MSQPKSDSANIADALKLLANGSGNKSDENEKPPKSNVDVGKALEELDGGDLDHAAWPNQDLVDWLANQKAKADHVIVYVDLLKRASPVWYETRGADNFFPVHIFIASFMVRPFSLALRVLFFMRPVRCVQLGF